MDRELDELLGSLPAVSLEGPKGVGKTSTAERRAGTVFRLDDPATYDIVQAQPARRQSQRPPIVIDEWQRYPASWDLVRRAVDRDRNPGRFILTGSATPTDKPTHSGAGRIVVLRMRPLTLPERTVADPTVSLACLLGKTGEQVQGTTTVTLEEYTAEIHAGGFQGMRYSGEREVDLIVERGDQRVVAVEVKLSETIGAALTET